jgi:FKBP-type peptidyl-prolyl cis-trans isomerase SlyD
VKITEETVASISYKLSISNEETPIQLVETVDASAPMTFLVGNSGLPEAFEDQLEGLKTGDSFDFEISAEEAFGEYTEEDVVELPLEDFYDEDGTLDAEYIKEGNVVPMTDDEGNHVNGRILEINTEEKLIVVDFNHPLAGHDLHFEGTIVSVREATDEELEHGHVHGEGGHHH